MDNGGQAQFSIASFDIANMGSGQAGNFRNVTLSNTFTNTRCFNTYPYSFIIYIHFQQNPLLLDLRGIIFYVLFALSVLYIIDQKDC